MMLPPVSTESSILSQECKWSYKTPLLNTFLFLHVSVK